LPNETSYGKIQVMKKLVFLPTIIFTFLFLSCEKEVFEPGIRMVFGETQCANPWQALPGSKNYLFEVHQYLNSEGIDIYAISVKNIDGNGIQCKACICSSGRLIIIRIPETDKEKAETVGFKLS
jgi:hypothetical protein